MNNNYDYNYQQPQYSTQYQQPLYETNPIPDATPFFVMGIIGLALSVFGVSAIAGIIVSAIALSKAKAFVEAGGVVAGKAKVGKILATVGLAYGIVSTVISVIAVVFYIIYFVVILGVSAGAASYSSPYYYY